MSSWNKLPVDVLQSIAEEQIRQNGDFVPTDDLYLQKLAAKAELVCHRDAIGLAGFVFFYCNDLNTRCVYITLICVAPRTRGSGLSRCLLEYVLSIARQREFKVCRLEVRKSNTRALSFYKGFGFNIDEDRQSKYLMSKVIA